MTTISDDDLEPIRSKVHTIFHELTQKTKNQTTFQSWIQPEKTYTTGSDRQKYFDTQGFLLLPSFVTAQNANQMKEEMSRLVEEQWDCERTCIFRTDKGQEEAQGRDDYFLNSADKVHFFAEKDALDENGSLKEEFRDSKISALNKSGHGLHLLPDSPFHEYSTSPKLSNLVQELGWVDPVVPQSMYIFKQPKIGGEVTSHQDSTFLFTEPRQTCLGLWLALDDATLQNGCLWVRPGSHRECLRRKFVRNPDYFCTDDNAHDDAPLMIFESLNATSEEVPWDGSLPENWEPPTYSGLFHAGFLPVECRAGDLLVFNGELDHLSLPNYSDRQRHTFQLHLVEGCVTWAESNWLQYAEGRQFLSIASKDG